MTPHRRQAWLACTLLIALGLASAWSVQWMGEQRDYAAAAAADLADCRSHVAAIQMLRKQPAIASIDDVGVRRLGERINAAAQEAKLDPAALEGVTPQSARRLGDSAYLMKPTALALRGVSMAQTAAFLHHLTQGSGLTVRELRLRAPSADAPTALWDADATLTYVVYSPATKVRRER